MPCTEIRWAHKSGIEQGSDDWAGKLGVAPMYAGDLISTLSVEVMTTRTAGRCLRICSPRRSSGKEFPDALWAKGKPPCRSRPATFCRRCPRGWHRVQRRREAGANPAQPAGNEARAKFAYTGYQNDSVGRDPPPGDIDAPGTHTLSNTVWGNGAVNGTRAGVLGALAAVTPHPLNEVSLSQTAARAATIFQAEPTPAALGQLLP